jgi:hypothetical protein
MRFDDAVAEISDQLDGVLARALHRSYAVCHTASSAMPRTRTSGAPTTSRSTRTRDSLFPYRISYVCNLHQNDPTPGNPYNSAALPQYFVSLVDDLNRIPRQDMLDRVLDERAVPAPLLDALPQATRRHMRAGRADSGYRHELPHLAEQFGDKAWTVFCTTYWTPSASGPASRSPPQRGGGDGVVEGRTPTVPVSSAAAGRWARACRSSAWNKPST